MDPTKEAEVVQEFLPFLRIHRGGNVERLRDTDFVPATTADTAIGGISSKDVTISTEPTIAARLFLPPEPPAPASRHKLPLLVHFHGGGFCVSSPFSGRYHRYVQALVAEAKVVAVSVDYRKAPENPIPAAYEDSWAALHWAFSHSGGTGPEDWLNRYADFGRVLLVGESAGGNIAHNLAMAAGNPEFGDSIRLLGIALVHPYFWGTEPIGSEAQDPDRRASVDRLWPFICPSNSDNDDPRVNPVAEGAPSLAALGCGRVLVCVAEKDVLRDRGWMYYEAVSQSGWPGVAEIMETEAEGHCFHLDDLESPKAKDLIRRLAAFLNRDMPPWFS